MIVLALIPKKIWTRWSGGNKEHYLNKGYKYTGWLEWLEVKATDLPEKSNIVVDVICDYCGEEYSTRRVNLNKGKHACKECKFIKRSHVKLGKATTVSETPLIREWSPKNKADPNSVLIRSNKMFLWKCKECHNEWESLVSNRTNGSGCPNCARSENSGETR